METYQNFLFWGVTAGIGYLATIYMENGNPHRDNFILVWAVTLAVAIAVYVAIIVHRRGSKRDDELLKRMDRQDEAIDKLICAQQQSMRTSLIHYAEKYIERGWITSEELRAWSDMYGTYDKLGLNGYMHSYMERIDALPLKSIDMIGAENND